MKRIATLLTCLLPLLADAGICDHTPSKLVGPGWTASVATGAGATAAADVSMKAAGFYTLSHPHGRDQTNTERRRLGRLTQG